MKKSKKYPIVSILIVTYNSQDYIKKTLDSCLKQTYKNKEILILDNNSKDKTKEILKKYRKNEIIKLFFMKSNMGPYGGINFLIKKSKGKFMAIQDHDDIWLPEKLNLQINFLLKNKDFIAVGSNTFNYFEKENLFYFENKEGIVNCVNHTSLLFKKIKPINYKTDEILTDEYFQKKILSKYGKIFCLKKPLTIHRIRGDKKNFSRYRFKLNISNLKSFKKTNGINKNSIIYLTYILLSKYLPNKLLWFLRNNITMKKGQWIKGNIFKKNLKNKFDIEV